MKGFQPGEKVNISFDITNEHGRGRSEIYDYLIAPDGIRSIRFNLAPGDTQGPQRWHSQVAHARGVACAEVEMP